MLNLRSNATITIIRNLNPSPGSECLIPKRNLKPLLIKALAALLLLMPIIYSSCSDSNAWNGDDEHISAPITVPVSITIKAENLNASGTRTDDIQTSEPTDNEKIHSWWMAFVKDNKVEKVISSNDHLNGVMEDYYTDEEITLMSGFYTVYAFANIDKFLKEERTLESDFASSATWDYEDHKEDLDKEGSYVPMTGVTSIAVIEGKGVSFQVEVIRLWAKVTLEYSSSETNAPEILGVTMLPANTAKVNLFPDYEKVSLDYKSNSKFGQPVDLPDGVKSSDAREITYTSPFRPSSIPHSEMFYLFESNATTHPIGTYVLLFKTRRNDSSEIEVHTAHLDASKFSHINRNDLIVIPICLTPWNIDYDISFYPPIAGYSAMITESQGDEFYAKFGTFGKFSIKPKVTDKEGNVLRADEYTMSISLSDPDGILKADPKRDELTGNIVGEIKQKDAAGKEITSGHCVLTLTFKINNKDNDNKTYPEVTRKIHIIRESKSSNWQS